MDNVNYSYYLEEDLCEGNLNFYYLKDKSELAEFIDKHYRGDIQYINRIPLKKWFLYYVDDSGDYVDDYIILLEDYKKALLESMLKTAGMYKFLSDNCK